MGDRTAGQLTVYWSTPKDAQVVMAFIEDIFTSVEWTAPIEPDKLLLGGERYTVEETDIGMVFNATLARDAPDTAYFMWVDPKYEFLGDLEVHVPGLGVYSAPCDADGNPVHTWEAIKAFLDGLPDTVDDIAAEIGKLYGRPWYDAIAAHEDGPEFIEVDYEED